jgi:hypothetical protein
MYILFNSAGNGVLLEIIDKSKTESKRKEFLALNPITFSMIGLKTSLVQ